MARLGFTTFGILQAPYGDFMWWLADGYVPTWSEASKRLEQLHDFGPTPHAFNFGTSFNPDGMRVSATRAQSPSNAWRSSFA